MHRPRSRIVLAACACLLLPACAGVAVPMVREHGVAYPGDPAPLAERIGAGNIDQAGSEAFLRWGDGYPMGLQASDRKFTGPASRP